MSGSHSITDQFFQSSENGGTQGKRRDSSTIEIEGPQNLAKQITQENSPQIHEVRVTISLSVQK